MVKKTLEDLKETFKEEPIKYKKIKGSKEKIKVINWSLDSRNLMTHFFFNVLGEKHRKMKDKLPSIKADVLNKMKNPIAKELVKFRSETKTLNSFKNVSSYINSAKDYLGDEVGLSCKANLKFNIIGFDNVERIFTVAKESIPINTDKRARKAFITPSWDEVCESELTEEIKNILNQLEEK